MNNLKLDLEEVSVQTSPENIITFLVTQSEFKNILLALNKKTKILLHYSATEEHLFIYKNVSIEPIQMC